MAVQIVAEQTGALSSAATGMYVIEPREAVTVMVTGTLTGSETIPVAISNDGGTTFPPYSSEGVPIELSLTNTAIRLFGPCIFQMQKGATAAAAGVAMSTRDNP